MGGDRLTRAITKTARTPEAREYLEQGLRTSPAPASGVKPALERAKTLYMLGRHDEACEMYDWAFSSWPKPGGELLSNMGVCTLR